MAVGKSAALESAPLLPPILAGQFTHETRSRVEAFFLSVPELLDTWVNRCRSPHTRRCYREDVLRFVEHLGLAGGSPSFADDHGPGGASVQRRTAGPERGAQNHQPPHLFFVRLL
jgi:hypothetical protein